MPTEPVPESVAPLLTVTPLAGGVAEPFTMSVPLLICVPPEYVLAPVSVTVPAPFLTSCAIAGNRAAADRVIHATVGGTGIIKCDRLRAGRARDRDVRVGNISAGQGVLIIEADNEAIGVSYRRWSGINPIGRTGIPIAVGMPVQETNETDVPLTANAKPFGT